MLIVTYINVATTFTVEESCTTYYRSALSTTYHHHHCNCAMPVNRPVPCLRCGQAFNQGWATINHQRVCIPEENEVVHEEDMDHEDVQTSDDDANVPSVELEEYIDRLERAGTLDTTHMLQYLSWKRRPLPEEILEICKFLRSVECGGGSSDGGALHVLRYAKSLGGRGDLLPKTIDTCWSKIAKVHFNLHFNLRFNLHVNLHCNVHLNVH
jgi:hypothetical protein